MGDKSIDKQFGDVVRRKDGSSGKNWLSFAQHYGVYLGSFRGQEVVFDLTKDPHSGKAVCRYVSLNDFKQGKICDFLRPKKKDAVSVIKARMRELTEKSEAGNLIYSERGGDNGWQCEEAALYVTTGERKSNQIFAERKTHKGQVVFLLSMVADTFWSEKIPSWLRGVASPGRVLRNNVDQYNLEKEELDQKTFNDLGSE